MRKNVLLTLLLLFFCSLGAGADEQQQVEMLKEVLARPIPQWKEVLARHRGVIDNTFFGNVEKRIRWALDHNHVDDAIRFSIIGDFASEVTGRPANFRTDLAQAFYDTGNIAMMRDIVINVMLTSPGNKKAIFLRAVADSQTGNIADAYNYFSELAQQNYEPANCYYEMGKISLAMNQEKRGVEELEKASNLGHPEAGKLVAQIKSTQMVIVPDGARDNPRRQPAGQNTGSPSDPATLLAKATMAIEEGELEAAEDNLKQVIQAKPNEPTAYIQLGAVYYRWAELPLAIETLTKATQLDAGNPDAWRYLGNALERQFDTQGNKADLDKARAAYEKSLGLNPGDPLIQMEIARVKDKG